MNVIDILKELNSVKQKFGTRYFADAKAIQMAADLWGAACNDHGVCSGARTEIICKAKRCSGEFEYVATSKGYWLIGVSAQTSTSGFGYAPSVWSRHGYNSYHDARLAAVVELHEFFNKSDTVESKSQREQVQKILIQIKSEKTPQLNLF